MAKRSKRSATTIPAFRRDRINTLKRRMVDWKTDALLISNDRDIRYLTGFTGEDSWAVVLARSTKAYIISDSRFEEQIPKEAPGVTVVIRKGGLIEEIEKIVKRHRMEKLALQAAYLTIATRKGLASKLGARNLKDVDDGLIKQRAIKDAREIELLTEAGRIQQKAFRRTCKYIKPGMTEGQIAGYLEMQMRALGADGPAFPTIVGADASASVPHYTPGQRKAKKGGIILIDWGACYQGYRSDMTRVVALKKWPKKIKEIYSIVLEAQLAGIEAIAPGVSLKDVDKAARDVIKKAGYAKRFRHGLGHGIGLDIHEQPNLSHRATGELEPGQVVTVEPGIYLQGVGGVRLEDDVLVTDGGHRVLTDLPKSLDSAII